MDISGVPSPHMNWDASNLPVAWRKFKLHVEFMFTGPFKKKPEDKKLAAIFFCGSEKRVEISTIHVNRGRSKGFKIIV